MRFTRRRTSAVLATCTLALFGPASLAQASPRESPAASPTQRPGSSPALVGLGKVLTSSDHGQIFGWDIDENGTDGVLATATDVGSGGSFKVSVETFDERTGKIVHTFAVHTGTRLSYVVRGIFANDVGLVTKYVTPHGTIYANRHYTLMNPVTANRFTGTWTTPVKDFDVLQNADNQATSTSVVYGIRLKQSDDPALMVSDLPTGTARLISLDSGFGLYDDPELAEDATTGQAVIAYSPDGGAVGGSAPLNAVVNLTTGHIRTFTGLNLGPYGSGSVNGIAVDPTTDTEVTTTELNAQVEFYNIKTGQDFAEQLPGTSDASQLNSGASITNDPVHGLFLVADPDYAPTGGSAIVVYDETGNVVEAITGFTFGDGSSVMPVRVAVNPSTRTGWVDGPSLDQLQQFHY